MFSIKFIFFVLSLVAVLMAQMPDEYDDQDLEAIEDITSTQSYSESTESMITPSKEEHMKAVEDITSSQLYSQSTEPMIIPLKAENMSAIEAHEDIPPTQPNSESSENPGDDSKGEETSTLAILIENSSENSSNKSAQNVSELNESNTTFSCYGRPFGQYADVEKECRIFHLCYPYFNTSTELLYQRITFLCDNNSVFDQKRFICAENSTIEHNCSDSEDLYLSSNQEYLIRVFSQSVSPGNEMQSQSSESSNINWLNWLTGH